MNKTRALIIVILLPIAAAITAAVTIAGATTPLLDTLQEDFRKSAEQKIINQWTKPHTITWANTGRTFKRATKVDIGEQSCSFICDGKRYYLTGSFLVEEE